MALNPGTRLGPYEILEPLGAGGMGEVYRARDTRLDRSVAVKVLPTHLASSPELLQRFEREARAVSSLTHPNICTLHDVGEQEGIHFLVMEHLQGETLAARLSKGPLPLTEALGYAIQIADALDKAHRQSVLHRDLKPGNIMLTKAGAKLLDFGLAKSAEAAAGPAGMTAAPTATSPLTAQGTILGTFQYMAPEQLEGAAADVRSEIFSFGMVLHEMITGRRAFEGKTHAALVASILKETPQALSALQPFVPAPLERLVSTCLEKDPDERRQTMHDILIELRWIAAQGSGIRSVQEATSPAPRKHRGILAATIVVLAAVAAGAAGYLAGRRTPASPTSQIVAFEVPPPPGGRFRFTLDDDNLVAPPTISPDGRQIVFGVVDSEGRKNLWLRKVDEFEARMIPGTDEAISPFWSPDGAAIGFASGGKLKRLLLAGGAPVPIADAANARGATWSASGKILYSPSPNSGLYEVPAQGGPSRQVTTLDPNVPDLSHRWPAFLPDGERFVFLVWSNSLEVRNSIGGIYLGSTRDGKIEEILENDSNPALASGRIYFTQARSLMTAPFDQGGVKKIGEIAGTGEEVHIDPSTGRSFFSVSESSSLIYVETGQSAVSRLAWFDRAGKETGTVGPIANYGQVRLSPDGKNAAVSITDTQRGDRDLWIIDLGRGMSSRFTLGPSEETDPVWSPDSLTLAYASDVGGPFAIYTRRADGGGAEKKLLSLNTDEVAVDWSPDGRRIIARNYASTSGDSELFVQELEKGEETGWMKRRGSVSEARFSPEGRWVAYVSDESGRDEVYVCPFPGPGGQVQISGEGGEGPRIRDDGREILYKALDGSIMAVEVESGTVFQAGVPKKLFSLDVESAWDATRDHTRFLATKRQGSGVYAPMKVVLGWAGRFGRP